MLYNEPTIYKTPTIYNGAGGIYKGRGVYKDGAGGDTANIGGRDYKIVTIGDQTWLAENLDYKFSGLTIGPPSTPSTPCAWYYANDEQTYGIDGLRKCGLLYNWHAVKYLNDNRENLCPGWHVPTIAELDELISNVGGTSTAGTELKAINGAAGDNWPTGWNGADNYSFGVLPAGYYSGAFYQLGTYAYLWSIIESGSTAYFKIFNTGSSVSQNNRGKIYAYSVRLVKD